MKKQFFYIPLILLGVALYFTSCGTAQSAAEKEALAQEIAQNVNDLNFTFNATYAYPTGFRSIYLSPYYDVKVSQDTVKAYLPYYGRAYTAPMNPSEGGIKFTSTDFEYQVQPGKRNGNWLVQIRPNDLDRQVVLYFDIWENGTARLDVSDYNRQPISFQGNVETKTP